MAGRALGVWLYGVRIARLSEPRRLRLRLDFTEEALDVFGEGSRVLSLALPISRVPAQDAHGVSDHRVSAFIEGLFPEGNLRRHITSAAGLVANLPTYQLPDGAAPQASLAGIQDKVLLVAMPDGGWGWPENGAASTHITKPEPLGGAIAHLVQAEDWALRVARTADKPSMKAPAKQNVWGRDCDG